MGHVNEYHVHSCSYLPDTKHGHGDSTSDIGLVAWRRKGRDGCLVTSSFETKEVLRINHTMHIIS
jgi:hypothetical protein